MSVPAEAVGQPKKAATAAWIGSALEYYDFFIYGSAAALIFPKVFFDESDPATATLLSLATFGVAYAARPVGALFLGHFGDRLKVKNPGVIDENIDAAEGGYGFGEKAIDIGFLRDVRLHGDGFAALAGDVGDNAIRAFFARGIIDDDGSTGVTKVGRNGGADTFGGAGDDGDFTAEFL